MEKHIFKIFDAHMHSYGTFLNPDEDVIDYINRFNVENKTLLNCKLTL